MKTRVRQAWSGSFTEWRVDRLVLWFFWLPIGHWIHADWWVPYRFETAHDAEHFSIIYRAKNSKGNLG